MWPLTRYASGKGIVSGLGEAAALYLDFHPNTIYQMDGDADSGPCGSPY